MAALAAGFGGTYLVLSRDDANSAGQRLAAAAKEKERTDASDVATALKVLERDPAAVLATDARKQVPDVRKAIPDGTTVKPLDATWAPDGTGVGGTMAVDVTYPGKSPRSYLAVMVHEKAGWKVLATLAVTS
ncbi:MAG: hypothetical protein V9G19_21755 [Tetrasphaera sp.]